MSVVQAVCKSTESYLMFLLQQRQGQTRHQITSITPVGNAMLLGSVLRQTYTGRLPPRLSLIQDSSATLILDPAPDLEIEIHILAYDRSTGDLKFATREPITAEKGQVLIDFIWLIRRCLQWYQTRGLTIPTALPELIHGLMECGAESLPAGLSPEKLAAIQALLAEPSSYIWGPPGTGKTNWVLAKAARLCLDGGEKILVLASINLAGVPGSP